eukprot:jgi/Mesen1/3771/ME000205S03036
MEVDTSHLAGAGSAALGGNQSGDKKLEPQRKSFSYFPRHVLHMYPRQAANKFPPCIPPEHRNKVSEMRKALTKAGLKADHFQNCTLYRFLKARDHNVPKATAMFSEMVRWRKEFGADTISEVGYSLSRQLPGMTAIISMHLFIPVPDSLQPRQPWCRCRESLTRLCL